MTDTKWHEGLVPETITVSADEYDAFVEMCENPAPPTPTLLAGYQRLRELMRQPAPWSVEQKP